MTTSLLPCNFPRCRRVLQHPALMFREQLEEAGARSRTDAALGNQPGHQPRRGYVEGVVSSRAVLWREPHGDAPPVVAPTLDMCDLAAVASLDRDLGTVLDLPVDGRRGERHIERDVVVAGRQRLCIGADLVRDIAARGGTVGADNAQINEPFAHDVTGGVVDDHRMWNTVLRELPSGEPGALVARPRLVDPDMHRDSVVMGAI